MATAEMKQQLEKMIKALIAEDTATADEAFSNYVRIKSKSILGEEDEAEEEKDEKDEDEEDKDDEDEDEGKEDGDEE
jgi:hypothetical protein